MLRREHFPLLRRPYVAPRTPTERSLAEIWADAMSIDRVGIEDRYLDLGGDSLMAAVIFSEIEERLGVRLAMATLDSAPTIADLASRIDALPDHRRSIDEGGSSEAPPVPTRGASAS